jgi:hypothetical protein
VLLKRREFTGEQKPGKPRIISIACLRREELRVKDIGLLPRDVLLLYGALKGNN